MSADTHNLLSATRTATEHDEFAATAPDPRADSLRRSLAISRRAVDRLSTELVAERTAHERARRQLEAWRPVVEAALRQAGMADEWDAAVARWDAAGGNQALDSRADWAGAAIATENAARALAAGKQPEGDGAIDDCAPAPPTYRGRAPRPC